MMHFTNLRESESIEQDCYFVWLLFRPSYYAPTRRLHSK